MNNLWTSENVTTVIRNGNGFQKSEPITLPEWQVILKIKPDIFLGRHFPSYRWFPSNADGMPITDDSWLYQEDAIAALQTW